MGRWEITKGTKITCPQCKAEIAIVTRTIDNLYAIARDKLKWVQEPYSVDKHLICRECFKTGMQVAWVNSDQIHTEKGWKP